MSSTLDIKKDVATQLGKTDWSTPNIVRDEAIKRARRKFYKEYKWSFLNKQSTIVFLSGTADIPVDYDTTFEPTIYAYSGSLKTEYKLVPIEDVSGYNSDYPVFGIDLNLKKFTTNLDGTLDITYRIMPVREISDAYIEPCDDISAISALATAYFWLAKERNDDFFKMFLGVYDTELSRLIREDRLKEPVRLFKTDTQDYGFGE